MPDTIDTIDSASANSNDGNSGNPSIIQRPIRAAMTQSYMDYAMSVITGRALPDVRDGCKPVHRRVLWAMHESGNKHSAPYKKSARMVGDVLGKYHPHGDSSVYDTAVRMAQPFTMGHLLIDGQGNFGSIDGDPAAAMRYTEMRLTRLAGEFFDDIHKETILWQDNYDGREQEPSVLPVAFPLLLVNGTEGIAVGMAASIPPHNLGSVIDATLLLMDRSDASTAELAAVLQAPDFPTGGIVHGLDGIADAIDTGRGRVKLRSKWHLEERSRGLQALVIDEIPYQVNKANLVAAIADLVKDKKIEDIVGLQDESSKDGIRIWIGLRKDASADAVFAELVTRTDAEVSVSYNCMVLVDGKPQQLGLRGQMLEWITFREEVILARHVFERKQALAKLHLLEGFMAALAMLDQVIATIRSAESPANAKALLMTLLSVDEVQAQAILDLKLQRLTGMELEGIRGEHADVTALVARLTSVIESPERVRQLIREELQAIKARYAVPRRTEIGHGITDVTREDMIPREDVLVSITRAGYIKRMPANALERQGRGTRGKRALSVGDDDTVRAMMKVHSHDSLLVFTKSGHAHGIKGYRIPEGAIGTKGRHIRNVIDGLDEEVHAILALPERDPAVTVLTVTRQGQVKRSSVEDYDGTTRKGGIKGVGLDEGDELVGAFAVREEDHIMLVSDAGNAIRFKASDVRVMGRTAGGVRGMKLDDGEAVIGAAIVLGGEDASMFLLCAGNRGIGKRTPVSDFPTQGRAGGGVITFKANTKTGTLVAAMGVHDDEDLIMLGSNGVSNRISVASVRETGRSASGVVLMNLDEGAVLVNVTTAVRAPSDVDDADDAGQPQAPATN